MRTFHVILPASIPTLKLFATFLTLGVIFDTLNFFRLCDQLGHFLPTSLIVFN